MADVADQANEMRADLEKQISTLKAEVAKITKSLGERASEAWDDAEDLLDDTKGQARRAARGVRRQVYYAAKVAQRNPGTAATILTTVGLLGLAVGLVLGGNIYSDRRR